MKPSARVSFLFVGLALALTGAPAAAAAAKKVPAVVGRWNLTIKGSDGLLFPSWLEVTVEGDSLAGRLCGRFGSAHSLPRVEFARNELVFTDMVDHEGQKKERVYRARVKGGKLQGISTLQDETPWSFTAVRAPKLKAPNRVKWGKPVPLITKGLAGWRLRSNQHGACWTESEGVLASRKPCVDIISDGKYQNFKLTLEFKLAKQSNSGIYLRGRYEIQINDDHGKPPAINHTGAVYGLVAPAVNPAKPADEWQSFEITLLGRQVTVVLNGETIVDRQEIAGPTGGALDSDEALPGPLMLQGDHGVVSFRNIVLTPAL
jgi:hypothetical protein